MVSMGAGAMGWGERINDGRTGTCGMTAVVGAFVRGRRVSGGAYAMRLARGSVREAHSAARRAR